MKRYDEYKQTGTPWIGEIPSHWESKRLRFICEFRNGYTPSKANPDFWTDGTIPWYRMEDIRDSGRRLNEAKQYVTEDAVKGGGLFEAGSFILATTATIGEHAVLIVDSLANQQFTNLKIRKSLSKEVDNEYFFYFLFVIDDYCKSTTKTATFAAVNIDDLKNFEVAIPPFDEQLKIVSYINKAIQTYDNVIAAQERRIALLEELKQSVITEAVTHGINPDAKLHPSGIDWIGNIPDHWEVMPFKRTMRICNGADYKHVEVEDGYPVIGSGGIFAYASDYLFNGEALLLGRKGTIDKPLYFKGKFWTVDTMFYSIPQKFIVCKYMYYQSLNFPFDRYSTSTALPSMTSRDLGSNDVCVPPLSEQQEIVEYIDSKIKPIDASIAKSKREIELLKELKQSVIIEAVTGKIKVC